MTRNMNTLALTLTLCAGLAGCGSESNAPMTGSASYRVAIADTGDSGDTGLCGPEEEVEEDLICGKSCSGKKVTTPYYDTKDANAAYDYITGQCSSRDNKCTPTKRCKSAISAATLQGMFVRSGNQGAYKYRVVSAPCGCR